MAADEFFKLNCRINGGGADFTLGLSTAQPLCAVLTWLGASNLSQRPSRPAFFESSKAMGIVPEAIVAGSLIAPPSTTHGDSIVDDLIIGGAPNDPP